MPPLYINLLPCLCHSCGGADIMDVVPGNSRDGNVPAE